MTSSIAIAADYADAMLVARRAKNLLFLLLLIIQLLQLALFFLARYSHVLPLDAPPGSRTPLVLQYLVGLTDFLGIIAALAMISILYLLLKIMLVGRLIGVASVTTAYIGCIILALLLFPWQAFLNNQSFSADFKVPGVLYTWNELVQFARFSAHDIPYATLKWARFVAFPVIALIILLLVQRKSAVGLRQALGEEVRSAAPQADEPPAV